MADVTRRIVSFAGSSVRIDSMDEAASHLVAFLFDRLAQVEGPPPHAVLRVRAEDQSARTLHIDGELYCEVDSLGSLASALLEQTLFRLSDRSAGGLLLHAAAVSRGSRCILLPGTSGAGKSSLTAWLLKQGFEYLTDELVYVPFGSLSVQPFTRPLALKASARGQLGADVVDFDGLGPQILSSPDVSLVPFDTLGRAASMEETHLDAIVFPRFTEGSALNASPLSRAETGLGLMAGLINARNLPGHGFAEATRIARAIPAWRLEYGGFAQLADWAGPFLL